MRFMPLPRWGLPDKGKPDGTHNQDLHFPPLCTTQSQSLPAAWEVVKRKRWKKKKTDPPQAAEGTGLENEANGEGEG